MININQGVELKENDNMDLRILPISGIFSNNPNEQMDALSPQPAPKLHTSKILRAALVLTLD